MGKVRLKDGTEYNISHSTSEHQIIVNILDVSEFVQVYNSFTESNLEEFNILDDNGDVCLILKDKYVNGAVAIVPVTDSYNLIFNLSDVDLVQKRLKILEQENTELKNTLNSALEAINNLQSSSKV